LTPKNGLQKHCTSDIEKKLEKLRTVA